jgi:hypothetical protein
LGAYLVLVVVLVLEKAILPGISNVRKSRRVQTFENAGKKRAFEDEDDYENGAQ